MSDLFKKTSKIVVSGNGGIGKTTLVKTFCYNQYFDNQKLTLDSEFFFKRAQINDRTIDLQIWDFVGEDRFRFLLPDFIQGAEGASLRFDVKRRNSFLDLKKWVPLLRKHNPHLPIVLLGLKKDLGYHSMLGSKMVKKFVKKFDLVNFIEVSSKENLNVDLLFKYLIQNIEECDIESIKFIDS